MSNANHSSRTTSTRGTPRERWYRALKAVACVWMVAGMVVACLENEHGVYDHASRAGALDTPSSVATAAARITRISLAAAVVSAVGVTAWGRMADLFGAYRVHACSVGVVGSLYLKLVDYIVVDAHLCQGRLCRKLVKETSLYVFSIAALDSGREAVVIAVSAFLGTSMLLTSTALTQSSAKE